VNKLGKGNEIKSVFRVDNVKHVTETTKNTEKDYYVLKGKDQDGAGSVQFVSTTPIKGFKPDEVIEVIVVSSQMSLEDFKGKEEEAEE
jgi:hypothetical protein